MLTLNSYTEQPVDSAIERLRATCNCIEDTITNEQLWQGGLMRVFIYLSSALRWGDNCNSLLVSERQTKVDLERNCCYDGVEMNHLYIQSVTNAFLYTVTSCVEKVYSINEPKISSTTGLFVLCPDTTLTSDNVEYKLSDVINCCGKKCGCETRYILEVNYMAGLNDIPDCIVDVICQLYSYGVLLANNCDEQCKKFENVAYNAVLKNYAVGDRSWSWEIPNYDYIKGMDTFFKNELWKNAFRYANKLKPLFSVNITNCDK